MSLWCKISRNLPNAEKFIKPIEHYPKPNTVQFNFLYCYDELILKINLKTYQCICYFNNTPNYGHLLDFDFYDYFLNLLKLYFTPYNF